MPTVFVKDYNTNVEFPDTMGADEIKAVLQQKFPAKQQERTFTDKALDFLTMGHVGGETGPEAEVKFSPEGQMQKANVPTGDPGFFQDPVTALAMGGVAGVRAASNPIMAAGREALGWFTGGGSEVPALAKAGVKGIVKAVEAPNLAKTAVGRAGKQFAEVPVTVSTEQLMGQPAAKVAAESSPSLSAKIDPFQEAPPPSPSNSIIPEIKGGSTHELPKYAEGSSINLERLDTTDDVKRFINNRTLENEAKIGKRPVSWEETRAQAEELGWDLKAIKKAWNSKGGFSAAEIDAIRQTNLNAISDLHAAIKDLPPGQTALPAELRAQVLDAMDLIKVTSQASSEAGRALNIHKRILANDPAFTEASQMNRVLKAITGKGGKRTDDLINGLKDVDFSDPAAVNRFIYDATKTRFEKLTDGAFELWINGLLSNPLTHIVNTTSNALTLAYTYPERILAAGIDAAAAKITGAKRGLYFGETAQDIFSFSKGLQDGIKRFADAMRKGDMANKLDYRPTALPEKVSKYLPTRALTAEDAFFKGFIENAELGRIAYRQAAGEGLKGQALQEKITELLASPTEGMLEAASKQGKYLTYQKELGQVGRTVLRARDTIPGLKYFIPFVKTPLNIVKFALERSPLGLYDSVSKALKGELKGAELSEQLAKPLMGIMLGLSVYHLAELGYITGGTPKKKGERDEKMATGWQPYSIKLGDNYYSFGRMEPLGSIMGMAADMNQIKKGMNEKENFNLAAAILGSITTNLSNKTFLQGLSNIVMAVSDPTRYGPQLIKNLAGSVVPSVSGGVARAIDPNMRDIRTTADTLQSRIPGMSQDLPAKLTVWGEPIERPGSPASRFLSPMPISEEKGSPIEKEMTRLDLDIGYPSRKIGKVELEPDEYWEMVAKGSQPAKKMLDMLAQSSTWKAKSTYQKEHDIKSIVNRYRESAHKQMVAKLYQDGRLKPENENERMYILNQLK